MVGQEIREKRVALGISQEQLARKIKVSVATIQRWEKGLHSPHQLAVTELTMLFNGIHMEGSIRVITVLNKVKNKDGKFQEDKKLRPLFLYLTKEQVERLGTPESIKVTIEAA